jgi:ketosteroid isomerase-like protein
MPDEELLRTLFADWERGDFAQGPGLFTDDLRFSATQPEGQIEARGPAGLAEFMQRFLVDWKGYRVELHELEDLGEDRWLVTATQHGAGKTSGLRLTAPVHIAIRMREGRIAQLEFFLQAREDALAALGDP